MAATEIVPGLYQIGLGMVSAYLLADRDDLTLIDTGTGGSAPKILAAVRGLGRQPQDIRRILITHLHADHTGSLAELKRQTRAQVYMHPADAELVRQGIASRPSKPAPGLIKSIVVPIAMRRPARVEPADTDVELADGQDLQIAGGLCAIGAAGHAAGQVVFMWPQHGGVLIAGDVAGNFRDKLDYPILFEDQAEGLRSLQRLAGMSFEVAVFGHGRPILKRASERFRVKWGRAEGTSGTDRGSAADAERDPQEGR
jgi:glyoxylase-like metal-dependent hydrolase (beta-lactamase superfamily II)